MLTPIQKTSLADAVFEQLRDQIVSGTLSAGSPLPSERALTQLLGVNRGAVREGLKRLAQARLVTIQQGGATRVLDYRRAADLSLLGSMLFAQNGGMNAKVARSVVEMRSLMAPEIARLAARRGGAGCARDLREIAQAMTNADGDLPLQQKLSLVYWGVLVDGTENIAYRLSYNTLRETYEKLQPLLTEVLAVEYRNPAPYHSIAEAVDAGREDLARDLAHEIINAGAQAILVLLNALDGANP